jgi:hypothetical protein
MPYFCYERAKNVTERAEWMISRCAVSHVSFYLPISAEFYHNWWSYSLSLNESCI